MGVYGAIHDYMKERAIIQAANKRNVEEQLAGLNRASDERLYELIGEALQQGATNNGLKYALGTKDYRTVQGYIDRAKEFTGVTTPAEAEAMDQVELVDGRIRLNWWQPIDRPKIVGPWYVTENGNLEGYSDDDAERLYQQITPPGTFQDFNDNVIPRLKG